MCTVTLVRTRGLVRLACNRDELRSRPVALPPRIQQFGQREAVLPVDAISGGTWVAVNDAGLAMTLLNVHQDDRGKEANVSLRSRGSIIPSLLHHVTLDAGLSAANALNAACFAPFRLVFADREEWAELRSDGRRIRLVCRQPSTAPSLFTSSGLGDHLVEGPRRRLFGQFFHRSNDFLHQQELFHRHGWPDRPRLSVCMRREDARTVSHTVVSLGLGRVTLTYRPEAPDRPAESISASMPIAAGVFP